MKIAKITTKNWLKQVIHEFERKRDRSILENMMDFLNDRKVNFNSTINLNKHNKDWVNEYKDYIVGKVSMCEEAISQLERLMK